MKGPELGPSPENRAKKEFELVLVNFNISSSFLVTLNRIQTLKIHFLISINVHDGVINLAACGFMENTKNLDILRTKRNFFLQ